MRLRTTTALMNVGLIAAIAVGASAATSIRVTYSETFSDPIAGTQRSVDFSGTTAGMSLTGRLVLDGASRDVTATIGPDGSISGRLIMPDGSIAGTFWGQRAGTLLKGSFDLGGQVGDWSVPASKLPVPK